MGGELNGEGAEEGETGLIFTERRASHQEIEGIEQGPKVRGDGGGVGGWVGGGRGLEVVQEPGGG